jgi:hypothetical protein
MRAIGCQNRGEKINLKRAFGVATKERKENNAAEAQPNSHHEGLSAAKPQPYFTTKGTQSTKF